MAGDTLPFSRFHRVSLHAGGYGLRKVGMAKARKPEIVFIRQGVTPEWAREFMGEQGWKFAGEPKPGPNVVYADRRTMPRECGRTGMRRDFCCCAPCRARRRRKHGAACDCWLCFADRAGQFIFRLGERTVPGRWALFLTQTYRTRSYPWQKGFPIEQPEPKADFVRHFFDRMIRWLESELGEPVEFVNAEQFGEAGGRRHQHAALTSPLLVKAAEELAAIRADDPQATRLPEILKPFAGMLWEKAGFNRILPSETDAAFYIGRYIGRDSGRCHFDVRVGEEPVRLLHPIGRKVIAVSAVLDDSSRAYRNTFQGWHR